MIDIDGSYGLGSGQLTRYALAFSALTGTPVKIDNIRSGRPNPGLKAQHLTAVNVLKKLCNASVEGNKIQSSSLKFTPDKIKGGNIKEDIGTAGSIPLLIQNIIYPCMFAKRRTKLEITGGTEVSFSPTIDYISKVFFPFIKPFVKEIKLKVIKRGYYPKGGGRVIFETSPKYSLTRFNNFNEFLEYLRTKEHNINLTKRGDLISVKGISAASGYLKNADVVRRQIHGIRKKFKLHKINFEENYYDTLCPGSSVTLFAEYRNTILGCDSLGVKGKKAEIVGEECAENLKHEMDCAECVDKNMLDNLIPLLALLKGNISSTQITEHSKTAMWICGKFINVKFIVQNNNVLCV